MLRFGVKSFLDLLPELYCIYIVLLKERGTPILGGSGFLRKPQSHLLSPVN